MLGSLKQRRGKVTAGVFGGAFLILIIFLGSAFDLRARCASGWVSSSIGSRGACSHHGGVDRTRWALALIFSLGVAGYAARRTYLKLETTREDIRVELAERRVERHAAEVDQGDLPDHDWSGWSERSKATDDFVRSQLKKRR